MKGAPHVITNSFDWFNVLNEAIFINISINLKSILLLEKQMCLRLKDRSNVCFIFMLALVRSFFTTLCPFSFVSLFKAFRSVWSTKTKIMIIFFYEETLLSLKLNKRGLHLFAMKKWFWKDRSKISEQHICKDSHFIFITPNVNHYKS